MSGSRLYAVSGFLPPLDRRSSRDAVAITVSVAFHLAAGLAVLHYGFLAIDAPSEKPEVVIKADVYRYVPPKAPPKTTPTTPVLSV
ncbi:MAG: hypothetical protein JWM33_1384, partial [Caulobacteraceae bacterium]|nr:hypothetical protein [Caulobacteraceae bacterium]